MGTAIKLNHERQSARMSKITNDGLTRSDTGCTHMAIVGVKVLRMLLPKKQYNKHNKHIIG